MLAVGATATWDFSFRVDAASGAGGSIAVLKDDICCAEDDPNGWAALDRDSSDKTAKIIVALPTPGGEGTGGAGGGLPVTGAATVAYAAGGAGMVVLGVVGVVLARRRRARFTA